MSLFLMLKKAFKPVADKFGLSIVERNRYQMCFAESSYRKLTIDMFTPGYLEISYFESKLGNFTMRDFMKNLDDTNCIKYNNESELTLSIEKLVRVFEAQIMPYIEFIRPLVVVITPEMYKLLSINTTEKANSFINEHCLSVDNKPENYRYEENILASVRGENRLLQKVSFTENIGTILGAASYLGKIKRKYHMPAQWVWYDSPEYINEDGIMSRDVEYCVVSDNYIQFDPLDHIISFWNHYPTISKYSLESYRNYYEHLEI